MTDRCSRRCPRLRRRRVACGGRGCCRWWQGFILILSVDSLRSAFVAVFADRELHAPSAMIPFVFTVSSALNLAFMPISGALADRLGARPVVVACACIGAVAALGTSLVTSGWQLLGLQAGPRRLHRRACSRSACR